MGYEHKVISGGTTIGFESAADAWSYILRTGVYPVQYNDGDCVRMVYHAEAASLPIEEGDPSVRVYHILRNHGCLTWGDVRERALYGDLRTMRNLGKKSRHEVYSILSKLFPNDWEIENARARDLPEEEHETNELLLDPDEMPLSSDDPDEIPLSSDWFDWNDE